MSLFMKDKSHRAFLKALKSGQVDKEALAEAAANSHWLADCKVDDVLWCLLESNSEIRDFGMRAIAASRERGKVGKLFALYRKEKESRQREIALCQAIAACRSQAALAEVAKMVNSPELEVRRKAHRVFVRLENWHHNRDLVVSLMEDPDASISFLMIKTVVERAGTTYYGYLRHLVVHDRDEIRELALRFLVDQEDPRNADIFFNRIPHERGEVRQTLVNAIVAFTRENPKGMTRRIITAMSDPSEEVRRMALDLFVRLPNRQEAFVDYMRFMIQVTAWLREMMMEDTRAYVEHFAECIISASKTEDDPNIRHHLVAFARFLSHPSLAPMFMHELSNPDWFVRYQAIQVLGEMRSPEALPHLLQAMDDPDTAVAAVRALDNYGDIRLAKPFLTRLATASRSLQKELVSALANMRDPRLVPYMLLFAQRHDIELDARHWVIEKIREVCEAGGIPAPLELTQLETTSGAKGIEGLPDLGLRLEDEDPYDGGW